jgi:hypothetical protein
MSSRMERASNLRLIALASVVALFALIPLAAATAGPPSGKPRGGLLDGLPVLVKDGPDDDTRQTASCGPQLASSEGLKAQTCTIGEDGDTWARTYYRNATGGELSGVLTLMGPDGRTVQVDCPIAADADAGSCETPHERTVSDPPDDYTAVAEIAAKDADRLLLRAGS